ncbi:MAG: hypothetical protein A3K10_09280 [Bacteroidetes bacterium RIFCSPLOWO2_12_FULL_31_6]|nr:MAG: hypothetical protein A3K10_09280 [Bacteroidetes bacterium RIFCSPLOWO2_12_FULL_31_6]
MKTSINKTFLILSICFLCSCDHYKSPYFNEILKSEKGNLRGVEIGTSIENVKAAENVKFLKDEMPEYLYYDYQIDMGNGYTVTYDFSENNELYEIEIAIYLDVIPDATILFDDFSSFLNNNYKTGKKEEDGYSTWNTTSTLSGHHVAISMINDSEDYGFITILVRDLDY